MEGKNEWPKPRKVNDTEEDVPTQHKEKTKIVILSSKGNHTFSGKM